MSELATTIPVRKPSKGAIAGYVEGLNDQEVVGWVWCPGHTDRLKVELRLGEQMVAHAVADQSRDDLAQSGIGDGRHAFTLPVPDQAGGRLAELRVVAFPIEGLPVTLEPPPKAPAAAEVLVPVQRGIETLISSQRLLHRNLQAALLQQGPSAAATLMDVAAAQTKLSEAIATVELFVVRLETALQSREQPATIAAPRRLLVAAVGMSCLAFLTSCWALFRAVLGG